MDNVRLTQISKGGGGGRVEGWTIFLKGESFKVNSNKSGKRVDDVREAQKRNE